MFFQSMTMAHFFRLVSVLGLCTHSKSAPYHHKLFGFLVLAGANTYPLCKSGKAYSPTFYSLKIQQVVFLSQNSSYKNILIKMLNMDLYPSQLLAINTIK